MTQRDTIWKETNSLFSLEQMGVSLSEWDQLQLSLKEKLFLSNPFFFPGNTPSLKSGKQILQIYTSVSSCCRAPVKRLKANDKLIAVCSACNKVTNLKRPILGPSKTVVNFKEKYSGYFLKNKPAFITELKKHTKPYLIGFFFVRDSKRIFDYSNAKHILLDMMVEYGYFEDDNADIVLDFPLGYYVDNTRPGAYVVLLNKDFYRTLIQFI